MEDIDNIFNKIERAKSLLDDLESKRGPESDASHYYELLSKEQRETLDNARQTISALKDKLGKELATRAHELDNCQEELSILRTRLQVGEIDQDTYNSKSKHLVEKKIRSLEKKVGEIQGMISAQFAENVAPVIESEQIASPATDIESIPQGNEALVEQPETQEGQPQPEEKTDAAISEQPVPVPTDQVEVDALPKPESEEAKPEQAAEQAPAVEPERPGAEVGAHKPSLHLHRLHGPSDKVRPGARAAIARYKILFIILGVCVLALLAWGGFSLFTPGGGSGVGDTAPNFVMQLADDNTTSLSSLKGKTVILVFWDRDFWDDQFFHVNGVARKLYTPDKLNQLIAKYPSNQLAVIAIASGTSNNEIDKLVHDYDIQFPVIVDSFGKLRQTYKISYEPTYVFLDKNGVIRARVEGPITNMADLEQVFYSTAKGEQVKPVRPPIDDVLIQSVTGKSAAITWTTDAPTSTQIDIDGKNVQTVITANPQTLHSLTLRDLSPSTSYHVRILYNVDNINVSEHSYAALADTIVSQRYVVNTSSSDTNPPELSNITSGLVSDSSFTVNWKSDEPATGYVDYSTDKSYSDNETQGDEMTIWHTVKVEDLKPDTEYYVRVRSKNSGGKETVQEIEPIKTQSQVEVAAKVGKRAPDFTLYTLDGTKLSLGQFLGKKVLLNFWLEGCPACEAEMPILQTAYDKYSRDQLVILAVNVRGDTDKVSYYVAKEKLGFPILMDSQGDVDSVYRAPYFPTTYFVDSKGIITDIETERFQTVSQIDDLVSKAD